MGGPHVRLRLRVLPDADESALEAMQQSARRFLDREPSTRSLDKEAVLRSNESILAGNSAETDGTAYPDNTFRVVPFRSRGRALRRPGPLDDDVERMLIVDARRFSLPAAHSSSRLYGVYLAGERFDRMVKRAMVS